jgi:CheY-like chemotaxis protein
MVSGTLCAKRPVFFRYIYASKTGFSFPPSALIAPIFSRWAVTRPVFWGFNFRMRNFKPVLLLEDDNVDAMTVKRALKDLDVKNPLVRVLNGEQALEYLQNETNPEPCVILLDLNMPKMNGTEFLRIVKADTRLKCIPVVVLTTSKADQDKLDCFDNSVAGYIVKPIDYQGFLDAMRILNLYWTLSELPGPQVEGQNIKAKKVTCP